MDGDAGARERRGRGGYAGGGVGVEAGPDAEDVEGYEERCGVPQEH